MRIARCANTSAATTNQYDADISEEDANGDEEEACEFQKLTVKSTEVTAEARELSLEAIIAQREEEAGREINDKEKEFLSLQLERQRFLQISPSERGEEDKKRYKAISYRLARLKPIEDFLKPTPKSAAERKKISRGKMSDDARSDERAKDRSRKANKKPL